MNPRFLRHVLYAIAGILFSNTNAYSADISFSENKYVLLLNGEIHKGDYQKIKQLVLTCDAMPRSIFLNSPGGDVEEAIKIGKLVRRGLFQSSIVRNGECNSACFIVWASAVRRFPASDGNGPEGKLGLHRPFFDRDQYSGLNAADAKSAYQELETFVRAYLVEIKVPSDIIETMFKTKSTDAAFITDIDMIEKLGQQAPFFEEWLIAKCGELSYEEDSDYSLLMAADLMQMKGTPLASTTLGSKRIESMSAGYRKYLNEKGSKISSCRHKSEADETKRILRELRSEKDKSR
jgi:hypothetical protein